MAATTIKLDSRVRDEINAEARKRGETAGSFLEHLLETWQRGQRFAAMREALATASAEDLESYAAETAEFEQLDAS